MSVSVCVYGVEPLVPADSVQSNLDVSVCLCLSVCVYGVEPLVPADIVQSNLDVSVCLCLYVSME